MKKRPWLVWLLVILVFAAAGAALWLKLVIDEQPDVHEDPGIPEGLVVPDPDSVE